MAAGPVPGRHYGRRMTEDAAPAGTDAVLVGLTGGIGSGKSTVARLLAEAGARIVDADAVAREVVAADTPGLAEVVAEFGSDIIGPDRELDRPRLGDKVFGDDAARDRLNAIVHPLVAERTAELLGQGAPAGVLVYDVPLLVEGRVHERMPFDLVVVVQAPQETRIERLVRDRGMTREQVTARMASQATDEQRAEVADVVLHNDGSSADLAEQVSALWRERLTGRSG